MKSSDEGQGCPEDDEDDFGEVWENPYENKLWFSLVHESDHPGSDLAVKHLMGLHKFKGNKRLVKRHLRQVLVNLRRLYKARPGSYLAYSRRPSDYSKLPRQHNPFRIGRGLVGVLDVLIKAGYLESKLGVHFPEKGRSFRSRVRPTPRFLAEVVLKFGLLHAKVRRSERSSLIEVRNSEKEPVQHRRTRELVEMEDRLKAYNRLLSVSDLTIKPDVVLPAGICMDDVAVYRVFNNGSLKDGGRFYGAFWHRINSAFRAQLLINGEETEELDYSGQHIGLLYALLGLPMPEEFRLDPYNMGAASSKYPRRLVKMAVLCAINCKSSLEAWRATLQKFRPKKEARETREELLEKAGLRFLISTKVKYEALIAEFLGVHTLLKDGLYQGMSGELFNADSKITDDILATMTNQGVPVLAVHDSFIVQRRHTEALLEAMRRAYLDSSSPEVRLAFTSIKDRKKETFGFKQEPKQAPIVVRETPKPSPPRPFVDFEPPERQSFNERVRPEDLKWEILGLKPPTH